MIEDSEIDAMRAIADSIRCEAECASYGYFPGGDPRDFTPDPEACSADEMDRHKAACDQWEAGDRVDVGGPHKPIPGGHITVSHFGVGVSVYKDADLMRLAQDLDDWIDRARSMTP